MCLIKSLIKEEIILKEHFGRDMAVPLLYKPYYCLSGFVYPNVFIIPQDDPWSIWPASWGLIPESTIRKSVECNERKYTLNAKAETIFDNRYFSNSILKKRCLIIADGFFKPHNFEQFTYPNYFKLINYKPFVFAGVYSKLDDELYTCSIITTTANSFITTYSNADPENRMPLVLDSEFEMEWIRNDLNSRQIEELMRVGFTTDDFEVYSVSRNIYETDLNCNIPDILHRINYE